MECVFCVNYYYIIIIILNIIILNIIILNIIIIEGIKLRGGDITPNIFFLAHTPAGAESDLNAAAAAPCQPRSCKEGHCLILSCRLAALQTIVRSSALQHPVPPRIPFPRSQHR